MRFRRRSYVPTVKAYASACVDDEAQTVVSVCVRCSTADRIVFHPDSFFEAAS